MIIETSVEDEFPNDDAKKIYNKLISANKPIYEGATQSILSISVQLLAIRSNWHVPQKGIDFVAQMLKSVCPIQKCLPENCYQATQLVSKLGLKARKIDCCVNGCMLYYKEDSTLTECRICRAARYVPRKSGLLLLLVFLLYLRLIWVIHQLKYKHAFMEFSVHN
jgi:hypothetical protein